MKQDQSADRRPVAAALYVQVATYLRRKIWKAASPLP